MKNKNKKFITLQFVTFYLFFIFISGFVFTDTVNASVDLTNDIVANYHLNENNGTIAYDSSENNHNGTLKNMENDDWVTGKLNNCLRFNNDSTNEYIDFSSIAGFQETDSFTLEYWIKIESMPTANIRVLWKYASGRGYLSYIHNTGIIHFFMLSSVGRIWVYGNTNIFDDNWHHVITTYDGSKSASGVQIYVDGNPEIMNTLQDDLTGSILNTASLKVSDSSFNYCLHGYIDEIVIYDKKLNQLEVDFRYNNGYGREDFIQIIYVDDNQIPSWYDASHVKTITEGINNISINGTVFVYEGNYNENIIINKTITLISDEDAKINPTSPSSNAVVYISENNVIFDGFEITQNSGSYMAKGVKVNADNVLLKNLTIHNFGDELIYLSSVSGANYLTVDSCTLYDSGDFSIKAGSDGSIYSNNVTIKNCLIYDNMGTWVYKGTGWIFEYNSIHDVSNMGMNLDSGGNHIARYNRIYNFSKAGIKAEKTSEIYHNTITMDSSGTNSSYYGSAIAVKSGFTGGIIKDNIITDCKKGIYMRSTPTVLTIDYNNVWNNLVNYYDCNSGVHDISKNPLLTHLYYFDLFIGSPCINNASDGTNIGYYQGSGVPLSPDFYFANPSNRTPLNNTKYFNCCTWLYCSCIVSNSNNDSMNVDFYISETGLAGSYVLLFEFKNASYNYFCVDIIEKYYILINTTYYWYIYAESTTDTSYNAQSNIFNFNTTVEGGEIITIDTTQFVIIIQLVLFMLFLYIGYTIPNMDGNKRTFHYFPFIGGLFIIFGALDFISLSITLNIYNLGIISIFLTVIGIVLLVTGIMKAFYYE